LPSSRRFKKFQLKYLSSPSFINSTILGMVWQLSMRLKHAPSFLSGKWSLSYTLLLAQIFCLQRGGRSASKANSKYTILLQIALTAPKVQIPLVFWGACHRTH
jgi:hypothetical protein